MKNIIKKGKVIKRWW